MHLARRLCTPISVSPIASAQPGQVDSVWSGTPASSRLGRSRRTSAPNRASAPSVATSRLVMSNRSGPS